MSRGEGRGRLYSLLKPELTQGLARHDEQKSEPHPSGEGRISPILQRQKLRPGERASLTWPQLPCGSQKHRPLPFPVSPSRPTLPPPRLTLCLPGCTCGTLGPPRSTRPLAICCSLGTSTAVSHDRDCRSPGMSSSQVAARSLQGGAGARAGGGAGSSGQLLGLLHLWNHPKHFSPPPGHLILQSTHP